MGKVQTDVTLNQDGKQVGYLRVPCPRNTSAWGVLMIPFAVIQNGPGPSVLFSAGIHGDEYEGPVALSKLIAKLDPTKLRGRLMVLPSLNLPALMASQRLSPIDQRDMNRSFPGRPDGSPTEVLADYISTILLPEVELVLDMHSGGNSLDFLPSIVMHQLSDQAIYDQTFAAFQVFGAPYGMILEELDATGMFDSHVESLGIPFLTTELGGGGRLSSQSVAIAERGVHNLLVHWGLLQAEPIAAPNPTQILEVPGAAAYHMAPDAGTYEPFVDLGQAVDKGQGLGQVHFLGHPQRKPEQIMAQTSGILLCNRPSARVDTGDCIGVIGQPMQF